MLDDPAVLKWLSAYDRGEWQPRVSIMSDFLRYLEGKGFESRSPRARSPSGLLEFHRKAKAEDREYELLDLLQDYINNKSGTYGALYKRYSDVKMFFKRNRVPLPDDDFKIKGNREPVQGRLTVDIIRSLVSAAEPLMKCFYLTLWMGIMDTERFIQFNVKCGCDLGEHLKVKGVDELFMVSFPGRKQTRNRTVFHTYIGKDALSAWKEYFDRIRDYPSEGEAALLDMGGKACGKTMLRQRHLRLLERLNYIKRGGGSEKRYGYHLHEFRDEAKTLLHLQGKRDGLDLECVDFWMGHVTDPNHYDKFFRDRGYTLEMYRIAEKYLNIVSGVQLLPTQDTRKLVEQIIANPPAFKILRQALREDVGFKLADIEEE